MILCFCCSLVQYYRMPSFQFAVQFMKSEKRSRRSLCLAPLYRVACTESVDVINIYDQDERLRGSSWVKSKDKYNKSCLVLPSLRLNKYDTLSLNKVHRLLFKFSESFSLNLIRSNTGNL